MKIVQDAMCVHIHKHIASVMLITTPSIYFTRAVKAKDDLLEAVLLTGTVTLSKRATVTTE